MTVYLVADSDTVKTVTSHGGLDWNKKTKSQIILKFTLKKTLNNFCIDIKVPGIIMNNWKPPGLD